MGKAHGQKDLAAQQSKTDTPQALLGKTDFEQGGWTIGQKQNPKTQPRVNRDPRRHYGTDGILMVQREPRPRPYAEQIRLSGARLHSVSMRRCAGQHWSMKTCKPVFA